MREGNFVYRYIIQQLTQARTRKIRERAGRVTRTPRTLLGESRARLAARGDSEISFRDPISQQFGLVCAAGPPTETSVPFGYEILLPRPHRHGAYVPYSVTY